jgi:hypothetical protein
MYVLILSTLLSLPLYPLNPTAQDTINVMNLHVTAGYIGRGENVSAGPEMTLKYEMMIQYPFILRTALEYRYGTIIADHLPHGRISRLLIAPEFIYYRGTDRLTGYLGGGPVYSFEFYRMNASTADSLQNNLGVSDVSVSDVFGYRITLGLRLHRIYSLEIGITELYPSFVFRRDLARNEYAISSKEFRFNDFRVTLGYLIPLKM